MSSYPESLPGPSRLGHKPKPRNFVTDLEGPAAYLNRERDQVGTIEVEFFFTAEQAAVFYAWWRDELLYGGMSFNCSWPAIRSGPMVVQFLAEPVFEHVYQGAHRVSSSVAVRGNSLPVYSCIADPYYNGPSPHTILSLHGELIVDSSSEPKTLANSGVVVGNDQKKFGAGSLVFNGTSNRLVVTPTTAFAFEGEDYTIEAWVRPTTIAGKIRHWFSMSEGIVSNFAYCYFGSVNSNGSLQAYVQPASGGAGVVMASAAGLVLADTWYHVAFFRRGSKAYLFLDGLLVAGSIAWVNFPAAKVQHVAVGSVGNGYTDSTVGVWQGFLDDLRVTRGVMRESPGVTAPVAALPDTALTDEHYASVTLLLHGDGANGGATFTDSSSYARSPLSVVGCTTSTEQFQFGTAAGKFTSTLDGAAVTYTSSPNFDFAGDFTIEFWCYYDATLSYAGGYGRFIACRRVYDNVGVGTWRLGRDVWQNLQTGVIFQFATSPAVNTWAHVAISRTSGLIQAFINGVLVGAYADTTNYSNPQPLLIGRDRDGPGRFTPFGGYIEDFRITNGVGRYRASFTPPPRTFCDRA